MRESLRFLRIMENLKATVILSEVDCIIVNFDEGCGYDIKELVEMIAEYYDCGEEEVYINADSEGRIEVTYCKG